MPAHHEKHPLAFAAVAVLTALALGGLGGCGAMQKMGLGGDKPASVELTGAQEVPPNPTKASGRSTIAVAADRTVSGSVIVEDMNAMAAHIHQGAAGANGPVIVPLTKTSEKVFSVPAGARLTESQYAAYKEGNLYVNVHSATYPGGEVRVQMKP
ncbi:CHRD domain-containing protein [Noviherbaspirillum galbum]|uniref:CHRD domain-containing protein n=1 Tax=Noviherbaspirillum galbum TaxID=2709383 RepID=A0A6B3SXE5_9BURK|nr:CHRD domain-containing protein [Noviherbaspirillum galbum]NEX63796.1 CHRD domain-containing protein [Noviherbaspirillum galbum]